MSQLRPLMDGDAQNPVNPHEENVDIGTETSNDLDLNVEQDCYSPKPLHVNGIQSSGPLTDENGTNEVLGIGTEFESDEHAYRFYNKYARLIGFSVRKDWINRSKVHGQVVSRKFTCSREGYRRKDKRDVNVKKHRKETRTGCLAHMIITRQPDGKYQVTHFEGKHNHDNINPSNVHLSALQSELDVAKAAQADSNDDSEPQSNVALEMMNRRIGACQSLDQLSLDYDHYLPFERGRDMNEGEAARLLGYFHRQHFENPSFFYAIQLDVYDKISNIFWADDSMVADYDHFGDVICLDTTCRTNREHRPFVQFIGANHHKQVVIFAAALLYDDTVESFNWLFQTFMNAMSGKKPKVILTEQETAVIEAVNRVLPETSHHVCVWQMYENTLKHLSHVVKDADSFASDLRSSIYDHKDEEDFTHAWESLMEKHDLQQNEWLRWMYREREKWSVVFEQNTFFVDMKGSHLGEILSKKLRSYLNSDIDMLQFFKHFESVVDEQRFKEIEANDEMIRCLPKLMGNVITLRHAINFYTPRAFEVFQRGYEMSLNVVVSLDSRNGSAYEYKANKFGQTRQYNVKFFSSDNTVICSCMKFERVGLLCSHALRVLDHRNIKVIPSQYILKRWRRDARLGSNGEICELKLKDNPKMNVASRYKNLCHKLLKLSARASESMGAYQFTVQKLDEMMDEVEKILTMRVEEALIIPSSSIEANASESEHGDLFLNGHAIEDQNVNSRMNREKEGRATPDGSNQINLSCKGSDSDRILSVEVSPPNNAVCMPSPSSAYVSSQSTAPNPIMQGLYTFEASQVIQCMYEQPALVLGHQSNANVYQPPNLFSNQHDSPSQPQLLQEQMIQSTYQESMPSTNQIRQGMDIDIQNPHSSSFMMYDHRYRTSETL